MATGRRRRARLFAFFVPVLFVGGLAWFTYAQVQREKLRRPLFNAIQDADAAAVRRLLDRGANPNARNRPDRKQSLLDLFKALFRRDDSANYDTALMQAAAGGQTESVRRLVERGADVNAKGSSGNTALILAALHAPAEATRFLLERGAKVNVRNMNGENALFAAIQAASTDGEMVKRLLELGVDAKTPAKDGHTPLFHAAEHDKTFLYEPLLAHGADVHTRDSDGNTLLTRAINAGNREVIRLLLDRGADPNRTDDGHTALLDALLFGKDRYGYNADARPGKDLRIVNREMLRMLLDAKADPNAMDAEGHSALRLAVGSGWKEEARMLIESGADVNVKDRASRTPLLMAGMLHDAGMVRLLLARSAEKMAGLDVNTKDREGTSALMMAAFYGDAEIVRLLVAHGADVNARGPEGTTPLRFGAESPPVVALLKRAGAKQ